MARRQSFLSGAAVLSAAVAVTKVLGAFYKIPLGNLLGSGGMAHFYAAYNVFNVLVMACAGMPAAISRTVSQYCALGQGERARRAFLTGGGLLGLFGALGSAAMGLFAPQLAALVRDPAAAEPIRALAPALLLMCLCSAVRGYTQGLGEMRSTAVSQILESLGKLAVGLALCRLALVRGRGLTRAVSGALWGVSAGGLGALSYLLSRLGRVPRGESVCLPGAGEARRLLQAAVPITAGAAGMSVLTLLDQVLVLRTLQGALGYDPLQAAAAYGEYTFGMTLFVLTPSLLVPLSAALMPCIAGALAAGRRQEAARHARGALRLALAAGMPLGVGLSALSGPILAALYPARPEVVPAAARHLAVLGIASVPVGLCAVSAGILQACGRPRVPLAALACGGAVKVLCDTVLAARPEIAVGGVSLGTLFCYTLACCLQLAAVERCCGGQEPLGALLWRPGLAAVCMALGARSLHGLLAAHLPPLMACGLAVAAAVPVYLILLLALGGITGAELRRYLPRKIRRKRHDTLSRKRTLYL